MERYPKMTKILGEENLLKVPTIETSRSFDVIEASMTKKKDTDLLILSHLDDRSLLSFCTISRYGRQICSDETFWRNRLIARWGNPPFKPRNWKHLYVKTIYYLNLTLQEDVNWAIYYAAKQKDLEVIEFLIHLGAQLYNGAKGAVEVGDINMVIYFLNRMDNPELFVETLLYSAAEYGQRDTFDFLLKKGATNLNFALNGAITSDNVEMVEYILSKMRPLTLEQVHDYSLDIFTQHGHTKVFEYFVILEDKLEQEREKKLKKKVRASMRKHKSRK